MVWTPYWLPSLPPRSVTSHLCVPSMPACLSHPLLCTQSILSRAQGHPRAASTLVSIPTVGCKLLEGKVQLSFPELSPVPCQSLSMEPVCCHMSMHMWAHSSVNSNGGTELPAQHLCSSLWYFWMLRTQLTGGKRAEAFSRWGHPWDPSQVPWSLLLPTLAPGQWGTCHHGCAHLCVQIHLPSPLDHLLATSYMESSTRGVTSTLTAKSWPFCKDDKGQ